MSTIRVEQTLPSRQVLTELPARVVVFLRASGAHAGIRGALARAGFSADDHREGWTLLEAVCAYGTYGIDPAEDEPAQTANVRITAWVQTHFPRLRTALARVHPEALPLFAGIESPAAEESVLALATWLSRLDVLEPTSSACTTLARRGLTEAVRAELHALVHTAQGAPRVESAPVLRAPREQELLALHRWYTDWAGTARAVITRRDYLIALGLAGRRQTGRLQEANQTHTSSTDVAR